MPIVWNPAVEKTIFPIHPGAAPGDALDELAKGLKSRAFERDCPRLDRWAPELSEPDLEQAIREARDNLQCLAEGQPAGELSQLALAAQCHLSGAAEAQLEYAYIGYFPTSQSWARYWGGLAPLLTLQAMLEALTLKREHERGNHFLTRKEQETPSDAWLGLRAVLAGSSPEVYAKAREVAQAAWPEASIATRIALACTFPTETHWAEEAALAYLAEPEPRWTEPRGILLLTSLRSPELAERVIRRATKDWVTPTLATLLWLCGAELAPTLSLGIRTFSLLAPARKGWTRVYAQIQTAEVAADLAEWLSDVDLGPICLEALQAFPPELARPALEAAPVCPAQQSLLADPSGETPLPEGLPELLVNPPWSKPRRKQKLATHQVSVPPWPLRLAFEPKEVARLEPLRPKQSTPEEMVAWLRSHTFYYYSPDYLDYLIYHLREQAIPLLVEFSQDSGSYERYGYAALTRVGDPGLAPLMATTMVRKKRMRPYALTWLRRFPVEAALGLIPAVVGRAGADQNVALKAMRMLPDEALDQAAEQFEPAVRQTLQQHRQADPLGLYPKKLPDLPSFWLPNVLPRPTFRGQPLPLECVTMLAQMLSFSTFDEPYAGLELVKAELDSDSLERFAWALFELWWQAGARSAAWAFHAMGWLGGDDCVRRLTALMRGQWLRDKQHKFTLEGLKVLAAIGTDLALMHLSSLANKSPVKKVREKADEMLEVVADHRQLSREELEDRIVPDLGLGPDGTRPLDFGPRQFVLAFDERLEPRVFEDGRPLARYPRPNASDDPAKVAEAGKLWKDFKKDAARLVPEQVSRLERAMAGRRRWPPAQFEQFFCRHPFLAHLARRLVWAVHHDQRVEGFRLAEDGTYADWQDDQFELPGVGLVGVAHPLELDHLASWHELFADYQLLQPFPQLQRPTYRPDGHNPLPALEQTVGFGPLLALEKRGWQRGQMVGMGLRELTKELPDGLTASLRFEPGVLLDIVKESQPQRVTGLFLSGDEPARFEQLHPVLCSELFLDYYGLTGR